MSGTLSLPNNANGVEIGVNVGNVVPVETQSMDIEVSAAHKQIRIIRDL